MAKHGNNASTSKSGSADLLTSYPTPPSISAVTHATLPDIYPSTNYAFLYAREFHPGMKHVAGVRRELPFRTIFNLLGPLANPVHNTHLVEARILGVAKRDMGPVFADALRMSGVRKGLVVCGAEDLDELSCAGTSYCWLLRETKGRDHHEYRNVEIVPFTVTPEDLGLTRCPLATVAGGKSPAENAAILQRLLKGDLPEHDPVLTFVLINTAALLAVSGVCDADTSDMGEEDDGMVEKERGPGGLRWKEAVRRARWCIKSGTAMRQWEAYIKVTNELSEGKQSGGDR